MKIAKVHIALVFAVFAAVIAVIFFSVPSSRGEVHASQPETFPAAAVDTNQSVKSASSSSARSKSPATGSNTTAAFVAAATENTQLRNELSWTFGGKQQRGWYLYDLLISQTLNTANEPGTSNFAAAIASWQRRNRLTADGVLDQDAFMRMVSQWQGNRLKQRGYPDASQLVTAPPADFYDPGRAAELRQVERNTYEAYKRMIAAAIADPELNLKNTGPDQLAAREKYLKIISSCSSRQNQAQMRRP